MNASLFEPVLPPEMLMDADNPANDPYFRSLDSLRSMAVHTSTRMRAKHVRVVKLAHRSLTNKEIAQEVSFTPNTVRTILRRPDATKLLATLRHLAHLTDGPNLELRQNMLWRIARRSEEVEPNTAIAALKELNKLAGAYPMQTQLPVAAVNITINQESMPRTALDEAHTELPT